MPMLPPDSTPNPSRILERVWAGKSKLYDLGLGGIEGYTIVVSPEAYDALRLLSQDLHDRYRGAIVPDFSRDDEPVRWTMFGVPIEADQALLRNEIRFRSEVTVP